MNFNKNNGTNVFSMSNSTYPNVLFKFLFSCIRSIDLWSTDKAPQVIKGKKAGLNENCLSPITFELRKRIGDDTIVFLSPRNRQVGEAVVAPHP